MEFYRKLGYTLHEISERVHLAMDKNMAIILNGEAGSRTGMVLYHENPVEIKEALADQHTIYRHADVDFTADYNNVRLFIHPIDEQPDILEDADIAYNMCGTCFGVGIESVHFEASILFWSLVGFTTDTVISDDLQYVTMKCAYGPDLTIFRPGNCPHAFQNPSLTYFNGKEGNKRVIDKLVDTKINIAEFVSVFNKEGIADNIIISDPGGLHSFIFNDG